MTAIFLYLVVTCVLYLGCLGVVAGISNRFFEHLYRKISSKADSTGYNTIDYQ